MVEQDLKNVWGTLLVRGVIVTLFGIAAVFWPAITLTTLVYLFSAFILASGLVGLVTGVASRDEALTTRVLTLVLSVLQIGVGVYLLRHPAVSFATLVLLIGFTLIIQGVFDVVAGLFTGEGATNKLLTIVVGALSVLAGIVVLFQPAASGVAFVWILGLYALVSGPLLVAMAWDVKNSINRPRNA